MAQRKAANRWKPDEEARSCSHCQTKFHLFCRRHHCRQCGDIFCKDCSSKKRIVPIVHAMEAQRVCDKCWQVARTPGLGSASPGHLHPAAASRQPNNVSLASNPYNSNEGLRGAAGAHLAASRPLLLGGGGGAAVVLAFDSRQNSSSRQGSATGTPGSNMYNSGQNLVQPPGWPAGVAAAAHRSGTSPTLSNGGGLAPPNTTAVAPYPREVNAGNSNNTEYHHRQQQEGTAEGEDAPVPLPSYLTNNNSQRAQEEGTTTTGRNSAEFSSPPVSMRPGMCIIPPDDMMSSSEEGQEGDDDDDGYGYGDNLTGTPPSMRPSLITSKSAQLDGSSPTCNTSGGALSFMAALEDATRMRQLSIPVLLYVAQGHELPIVANVESAGEVVDDIIERLTPRYFELKYGMRKRPKGDDLETLRRTLQFVNESGMTIPKDILVSDLCRRQERVVLVTLDTVVHHQKRNGSTRSLTIHSGFFMQSERSEESDDAGAVLE